MTTLRKHKKPRRHPVRRLGFTLVELTMSMAIMTILMGTMTSVIVVASHAIPDSQDPITKKIKAMEIVDLMASEIFYANAITEASVNSVTFTVADRGHGAAGPETIRYEWSGTPGDPLTRQYNGGTVTTIIDDVQLFTLVFTASTKPLQGAPKVLLVVGDDVSLNAQDLAKQALIESFGFSVQIVAASRSVAEFSPLIASHDVMYISNQITKADILNKSLDLAIGIITEKRKLYDDLGIAAKPSWDDLDRVHLIDNTHEITSPFAIGEVIICDSTQQLNYITKTKHAPGLQILADWAGWPELSVLDLEAEQYGGGTAKGRRVQLPWGDSTNFDTNSLNTDGLTIMRRAIAWAAARVVYTGARIDLQLNGVSVAARSQVSILNKPKAIAP